MRWAPPLSLLNHAIKRLLSLNPAWSEPIASFIYEQRRGDRTKQFWQKIPLQGSHRPRALHRYPVGSSKPSYYRASRTLHRELEHVERRILHKTRKILRECTHELLGLVQGWRSFRCL